MGDRGEDPRHVVGTGLASKWKCKDYSRNGKGKRHVECGNDILHGNYISERRIFIGKTQVADEHCFLHHETCVPLYSYCTTYAQYSVQPVSV